MYKLQTSQKSIIPQWDDDLHTMNKPVRDIKKLLPSTEKIQKELASAQSMDDFFGKEGIFSRLFAKTMEQMLETELTDHLGYDKYEARGRNTGDNRNGYYTKKVRTSVGDKSITIPRDRNGDFKPRLLKKYQTSSNEIEDKVVAMYARGMSVRDIQSTLEELYGIEVSPTMISTMTDKVWSLVEEWQSRPLDSVYPIIYLDAIHVKLKQDGKVENTAIHIVLGITMEGRRDILGHWVGSGAEGANFWLGVVTDLQSRGVTDIFIACMDNLKGFSDALKTIFPKTQIQKCVIHQIRSSLKYISWKDRKAFMHDLKSVYKASTKEEAEANLLKLSETWGKRYTIAIKSWENNWEEVSTFFDFPNQIRKLIYTTNTIEGYNRQLRKIIKTKGVFPNPESARKLLYLINKDVTKKWNMPIHDWAQIINQLAIHFEERMPL